MNDTQQALALIKQAAFDRGFKAKSEQYMQKQGGMLAFRNKLKEHPYPASPSPQGGGFVGAMSKGLGAAGALGAQAGQAAQAAGASGTVGNAMNTASNIAGSGAGAFGGPIGAGLNFAAKTLGNQNVQNAGNTAAGTAGQYMGRVGSNMQQAGGWLNKMPGFMRGPINQAAGMTQGPVGNALRNAAQSAVGGFIPRSGVAGAAQTAARAAR